MQIEQNDYQSVFLEAIKEDWTILYTINAARITPIMLETAIKIYPACLIDLNKTAILANLTEEMALYAVSNCGKDELVLSAVPENLRTPNICEISVRKNGDNIFFVPQNMRTDEMYMQAVTSNGYALEAIDPSMITEEMCKIAVYERGDALEFVPDKFKSVDLCERAVKMNGFNLAYVPETMRSEQLCNIAVKSAWQAIASIPLNRLNADIVAEAANYAKGSPYALMPLIGEILKYEKLTFLDYAANRLAINRYVEILLDEKITPSLVELLRQTNEDGNFKERLTVFDNRFASIDFDPSNLPDMY